MRQRGNPGCNPSIWRKPDEVLAAQIEEDTCDEHDVFCCPECFDQEPVDD